MYNEDVTRTPADEEDMWKVLWEQFQFVRHVLWEYPLETREDALSNRYRGESGRGGEMSIIRYRDTDPDIEQRTRFYEMGGELLPLVHYLLDEKKLTPEFVQSWGMIMYCHGFIAAHVFDGSDDLALQRAARIRTRDRHKEWVAENLLQMLSQPKTTRAKAEKMLLEKVKTSLKAKQIPEGFRDAADFAKILTGNLEALKSTYTQKYLSVPEMRKIVGEK